MAKQLHGRDHRPGGADPIPGVFIPGHTEPVVGARIERFNSNQAIPNTSNTDMVYDTVNFDTDNMADISSHSNRLVVNTAGLYLVLLELVYDTNPTGRRIAAITINYLYSGSGSGSNASLSLAAITGVGPQTSVPVSAIFSLNVGDYIASGAFQASGAGLAVVAGHNVYLSAYLVGSA